MPVPPPVIRACSPCREKAAGKGGWLMGKENWCLFQRLNAGLEIAHRERHAGMPGRGAAHLGSVVRNDDAIKPIALQDRQDAQHVDFAVIYEGLLVVRH